MPKPIDRNLSGDGYGGSMDHFADCRTHQCHADDHVARLVDNHSRAAFVTIGVKPGPGDFGNVIIYDAHVQTMLPRLICAHAHGSDLRVCEDDLRHGIIPLRRDAKSQFECAAHSNQTLTEDKLWQAVEEQQWRRSVGSARFARFFSSYAFT
jgi:hypothetical protein